jgi:periodic tryptophan protein 1
MITTLCWVPRGLAAAANALATGPEHDPERDKLELASSASGDSERESDSSELGLDQVLDLPEEFREERDQNLHAHTLDWEQEEAEDERFQPTDWLIFTGRLYADDSCGFEVCVLERPDIEREAKPSSFAAIEPNVYVHHDGVLASAPLCSAFTDYGGRCIAAVGTYAPVIELWDLASMNAVEPLLTLGSSAHTSGRNGTTTARRCEPVPARALEKGESRKRKKHPEEELLETNLTGHSSAVLCLAFHPQHRAFLASGSADCSIQCWDIRDGVCATTIAEMHKDKVQALAWHPKQDALLLTAGFDRRACLVDLRAPPPRPKPAWTVDLYRDPEQVVWLSENQCLLSDDGGFVHAFDVRQGGGKRYQSLWSLCSCPDRPAIMALAPQVPDMLVVGTTDGYLRVYDLKDGFGNSGASERGQKSASVSQPVAQVKAHAGALFSVECCPDEIFAFAVACGGSKGKLTIVDVAESAPAVLQHFRSRAPIAAEQVDARLGCLAAMDESELAATK